MFWLVLIGDLILVHMLIESELYTACVYIYIYTCIYNKYIVNAFNIYIYIYIS